MELNKFLIRYGVILIFAGKTRAILKYFFLSPVQSSMQS